MVYMILIACENLVVALLAVALLVAATSRGKNIWFRLSRVATLIVAVVIGVGYGALAFTTVMDLSREASRQTPFMWILSGVNVAVFLSYLIGTSLILRGWRVGPEEGGLLPRAATWPLGGLATLFLAAVFVHLLTIIGVNVAWRQNLAVVRTEAYLLAASVTPPRVPEAENAAPIYEALAQRWLAQPWPKIYQESVEALDALHFSPRSEAGGGPGKATESPSFDFANKELAQFLQERAGELALLRRAAAMPVCRFERDYFRPDHFMQLPEIQQLRTAACLLAVDARQAVVVGDLPRALEDITAVFGIARHAREPILISLLVSIAIERMAIRELEYLLAQPGLTKEMLAVVQLQIAPSLRRSFVQSLRMEEAMGLLAFCSAGLGGPRVQELRETFSREQETGFSFPFSLVGFPWLMSDLARYQQTLREMQAVAGNFQLPLMHNEQLKRLQRLQEELRTSSVEAPLTSVLAPALVRVFQAVSKGEAWSLLAAAGVGVCRYALQHGRLPSDWADLVPQVIPFVPVDPFEGKPLRMKLLEEEVVIYSVGPDFQDDGGRPVDKEEKGDLTFVVRRPPVRPNHR
jgi:hypothetical protein